ncbi:MAG: HPF/RaiA family ribosome-associated protein [Anaerolineae bacterium]|nr:HPF/RaiA family ribosome-associated protein [Anaerolineae bacterium]
MMQTWPFDFEFTSDIVQTDEKLRAEAETRVRALASGHTDIVGAAVAVQELTASATPHRYEARVVLYMRPKHIAGVEKAPDALQALQQALSVVEQQVRDYREKLRTRWRQP